MARTAPLSESEALPGAESAARTLSGPITEIRGGCGVAPVATILDSCYRGLHLSKSERGWRRHSSLAAPWRLRLAAGRSAVRVRALYPSGNL
jgi:hypothetical protein